jgi:hypothetical protein
MSHPISDHAEILILAETVFNFHALSLCRSLLNTMSHPLSDHAEILILAETVFNFHALAYAGAC